MLKGRISQGQERIYQGQVIEGRRGGDQKGCPTLLGLVISLVSVSSSDLLKFDLWLFFRLQVTSHSFEEVNQQTLFK